MSPPTADELSADEKALLLKIARASLEAAVSRTRLQLPSDIPERLRRPAGAFVTLYDRGELRGCVGYAGTDTPLYRAVAESAASAAISDPRFPPVRYGELPDITLQISVLSRPQPITPEEIQIGVHGLIVTRGRTRGLLLPQVAAERNWSVKTFLEQTCRKAGLPEDAWRTGAIVEAFTAEVIEENAGASQKREARNSGS